MLAMSESTCVGSLHLKKGASTQGVGLQNSDAPFEIEIGSGKGTFLLQESQQRVEPNYLGFEWAAEFYRYAADRIRRNHILNVKMVHGDATEFLRFWCEDNVADVLHLYFSDPWPKTRHHKRRVIQDATLKNISPGIKTRWNFACCY